MPSDRLAPDQAAYYRTHSVFSDPGAQAHSYADLPTDPHELARIARDLMIHRGEGALFGHAIAADRLRDDAEARYVEEILRLITTRDGASLTQRREVRDRFVGVCRDFVLLYCSFLRHIGVPARMRVGFADYFGDQPQHGDHVVAEYRHPVRGWLMVDPQLADTTVADAFRVDFDPMDVPRHRFLVAGSAWRAVRAGRPATHAAQGVLTRTIHRAAPRHAARMNGPREPGPQCCVAARSPTTHADGRRRVPETGRSDGTSRVWSRMYVPAIAASTVHTMPDGSCQPFGTR